MNTAIAPAAAPRAGNPSDRRGREWRAVAAACLAFCALVFCYRQVFVVLVGQWSTNDTYSHGFLIPFVSAYLLWRRRAALPRPGAWQPSPVGLLVTLVAMVVFLGGRAVSVVSLQEISMVLAVAGLALAAFGRRTLRLTWFPIAYLLFMIPVWDVLTDRLHYPFQLFSAAVGGVLMSAAGIPVLRSGTYLELPSVTLEVAKVCSGVGYLLSIAAVGTPLAYLTTRSTLKRVLVVGGAVVIAVAANPVRVALIGILSHNGIGGNVHGPWHALQGLSVAAVGYVALFVGVRWAQDGTAGPSAAAAVPEAAAASATMRPARVWLPVAVAACLVLAGFLRPETWTSRVDDLALAKAIPLEIGDWRGHDGSPGDAPAGIEVRPGELFRSYTNARGDSVMLYVGAAGHRRETDGLVIYWTDLFNRDAVVEALPGPSGRPVPVNRIDLRGAGGHIQILYWYVAGGRHVTNRVAAKLLGIWAYALAKPQPLVVGVLQRAMDPARPNGGPEIARRFAADVLPPLESREKGR